MDLVEISEAVALMAATGGIQGLAEDAARDIVTRVRARVRSVFHGDARSLDALEQACATPDAPRVRAFAEALTWYGERDEEFAGELAGWARAYQAAGTAIQNVHAGRDAYVAGRDLRIERSTEPPAES
ncbi:hypothetical protein AB0L00_18255 [Actinoallomurus sp. NPDC052308]|uniref:hypothetical protein n=1 Tax=Actinoallomurus sp. NPDC052308 TaxID=3155530 RepID=UPI00341B2836